MPHTRISSSVFPGLFTLFPYITNQKQASIKLSFSIHNNYKKRSMELGNLGVLEGKLASLFIIPFYQPWLFFTLPPRTKCLLAIFKSTVKT